MGNLGTFCKVGCSGLAKAVDFQRPKAVDFLGRIGALTAAARNIFEKYCVFVVGYPFCWCFVPSSCCRWFVDDNEVSAYL